MSKFKSPGWINHLLFSWAIQWASATIIWLFLPLGESISISIFITILIGWLWEMKGKHRSFYDLSWDLIGTFSGAITIYPLLLIQQ